MRIGACANVLQRPTAWDILRHKHIEKALELLDDFVVTTPLKSTPETKHRSLSGSLSNSDWSTGAKLVRLRRDLFFTFTF